MDRMNTVSNYTGDNGVEIDPVRQREHECDSGRYGLQFLGTFCFLLPTYFIYLCFTFTYELMPLYENETFLVVFLIALKMPIMTGSLLGKTRKEELRWRAVIGGISRGYASYLISRPFLIYQLHSPSDLLAVLFLIAIQGLMISVILDCYVLYLYYVAAAVSASYTGFGPTHPFTLIVFIVSIGAVFLRAWLVSMFGCFEDKREKRLHCWVIRSSMRPSNWVD